MCVCINARYIYSQHNIVVAENDFSISLMLMVTMRFLVHLCCLEGVTDALSTIVVEFHYFLVAELCWHRATVEMA